MKNRFYINEETSYWGDFNYVVTPEGAKIQYSFLCTREGDNPPKNCGYRLAYETNNDNYGIVIDPYHMNADEM